MDIGGLRQFLIDSNKAGYAGGGTKPVYGGLRGGFMAMSGERPYRGLREYSQGEFVYRNKWEGELDRFWGKEFDIARMVVNGRHPEGENKFILEHECSFVIYVTKGFGKIFAGEDVFEVKVGDV